MFSVVGSRTRSPLLSRAHLAVAPFLILRMNLWHEISRSVANCTTVQLTFSLFSNYFWSTNISSYILMICDTSCLEYKLYLPLVSVLLLVLVLVLVFNMMECHKARKVNNYLFLYNIYNTKVKTYIFYTVSSFTLHVILYDHFVK